MHRTISSVLLVLTLAILSGCLTADGTVTADGGATLKLTYPTVATTDADKPARDAVSAPGVSIESLTIVDAATSEKGPRRATATLATADVSKLSQVPLLAGLGAIITRKPAPDGGAALTVTFRPLAAKKKQVDEYAAHTVTVRLHLPGPVTETSGTKTEDGVKWSFPASDWAGGKLQPLSVAYGPAKASPTE